MAPHRKDPDFRVGGAAADGVTDGNPRNQGDARGDASGERLGMLGGTFDPPHVGHAIVAQDVLEVLELDRLLVVPAARPPHREARLPAELRYELVRDLFRGTPGIEASDLELRREGPSYTVDTLEALRREMTPAELYLVIGSDQLAVIRTWHRWRELPDLARIAVLARPGHEPPHEADGSLLPYVEVEVTRVEISSTRIRKRLDAGRSVRFLVPERIRERVERAWAAAVEN